MNKRSKQAQSDKTVYILDRYPVVIHGLSEAIESSHLLKVGWTGVVPQKLFEAMTRRPADVVILDILLCHGDGLEVIKQLRAHWHGVAILVVSSLDERIYAERAMRAGAHGFIMKNEPIETVNHAIFEILNGGVYLSDHVKAQLIDASIRKHKNGYLAIDSLSDRELEVFSLFGEGYSTQRIADHLGLSRKTIDTYRIQIKEKLNLEKANEVITLASQWTLYRSGVEGAAGFPTLDKAG